MMREMARRDAQSKEVSKNSDDEKQKGTADASSRRREFSLVESIPDATAEVKPASGAKLARGGGKKGDDDDDLFGRGIDLSQSFNESGATFKV